MMRRTLLLTLCTALLAAAPAGAASTFTIRGAGFGHGVGMSQYGAYGYALQGFGNRDILAHYYTGTQVSPAADPARVVRVLMQGPRGQGSFTGATRAGGRRLKATSTYRVRRGPGGTVDLLSPTGRRMKRVAPPLVVEGNTPVVLKGRALNGRVNGAYRGTLEFSPGYLGVQAVNAVGLEDYVRGVVGDEMPPTWHAEALKAQAIAARTYAVTTSKAGLGFEQYPDTRSQVYGGVAAEELTVDEAVAATRGELVTYAGQPVVTYFFSTSGGHTENVENSFIGSAPSPWLRGVDDPYDGESPKHRWTVNTSTGSVGAQLGSLVKGSFKGIEVTRRGVSPRIVTADIIGSGGRTAVDGATIRARLGLYDDWAYFTSISTKAPPTNQAPKAETDRLTAGRYRLHGTAIGDAGRKIVVQHRQGTRWVRAGATRTDRRGNYWFVAKAPGAYRIRFGIEYGPVVHVG
jgi:stage II sporulation protein D